MEISFRELTKKAVIDVSSGVRLGYVCDMTFDFQKGCVLGFFIPVKGVFKKEELFVPLKNVEKIGEDVVFVTLPGENPPEPPKKPPCVPPFAEDCEE